MRPLLKFISAALVGIVSIGSSSLRATSFELESTVVWNYGAIAIKGMTRGDFSGDGVAELAFITEPRQRLLVVYGQEAGEWRTLQTTHLGSGTEKQIALTWPRPSPMRPALVLVEVEQWVSPTSTIRVFSSWPLREVRRFEVAATLISATIADADGDGHVELVATSADATYAYSLETGALLWSLVGGGLDVHIARFSPNQAPQIVLSGLPVGRVYDGVTRVEQWSLPDGFGSYLASGRFDNTGLLQLVAAFDWNRLTVFNAVPWSPSWTFDRFDIDAVTTADLDGDGIDEIIQADGQWGSVNVIDAVSRSIRFSMVSPGHGTAALVAGDLTGDSAKEIAVGPRSVFGVDVALRLTSNDGEVLSDLISIEGGGSGLAAGDLLGDGIDRLVTSNGNRGIALRDLLTGESDWMSPQAGGVDEPFSMYVRFIRLAQLDADPALEVVLAGSAVYGRIVVFDPSSRTVDLQIGFHDSGPLQQRVIVGAELFDFDDDNRDDLLVATQALSSGSSGVKLEVYSLQDGEKLWESDTIGSGSLKSRGAMVVPAASGADALLVAAIPSGLRAYNARTHLLEWTLDADVRVARFFPDGMTGPEFAIAGTDGQLRFFDLATRSLQRSFFVGAIDEIHPLFGTSDALITADGRLRAFSATGIDLGQSEEFGTIGAGASILQLTGSSGSEILAATLAGYVKLRYRAGYLFANGFE